MFRQKEGRHLIYFVFFNLWTNILLSKNLMIYKLKFKNIVCLTRTFCKAFTNWTITRQNVQFFIVNLNYDFKIGKKLILKKLDKVFAKLQPYNIQRCTIKSRQILLKSTLHVHNSLKHSVFYRCKKYNNAQRTFTPFTLISRYSQKQLIIIILKTLSYFTCTIEITYLSYSSFCLFQTKELQ